MIDYETYCKIRRLVEGGLSHRQISRELGMDRDTVSKYAQMKSFPRRVPVKRQTILTPYHQVIQRWLERHPYTARQVFQMLRADHGFTGGYTVVKDYVRLARPVRPAAFLTLAFAPGEAAQVDWGCAGTICIGNTRRRLSFFVMVLCHSRMMYLEFTCGESTEHFLACHQNALNFYGGCIGTVVIDNLKTGVLEHRPGQNPVFNPRYLDFAAQYGFTPRACNVRQAHEKGRVENGVGYVKKNFLAGLELPNSLGAMNTAARQWLDTIANVRVHKETRQRPCDLFAQEKAALQPLPALPPDTGVTRLVRATNQCRIVLDTNRYSVPALYASQRLTLTVFADRLCLYHAQNLVASHPRSYERNRDFENPDHVKELLDQRRLARDAKWLLAFYALSPQAEYYYQQLQTRSLNARQHVNKIVALAEIYGGGKVAAALEDALASQAFSSQYIENILQQRARHNPAPGPLHLTRRADLLDLELAPADLSPYDNDKKP